jgi:predicted MFS family arabinose efflux permease
VLRRVSKRYVAAFRGLPRPAWLMATALLVNTSGMMVVFFLTLYLVRHLGWEAARAGSTFSGYGIGMLAGTLAGGLLSDRLGVFRVQRISLAGSAVILVALPALHSFAAIFSGIALWGFFASALFPANAAAMAALCPEAVRARGFVLNRMAANLGATIGPVVGGVLAQYDYRYLFWVDGATSLAASVLLLCFFPSARLAVDETPAGHGGVHAGTLWWKDGVFLGILGVSLTVALIFSQMLSTFGLYLKLAEGLAEARIGQLLAINTTLIVVLQMPLVQGAERFSGTRVAACGAVLLGAGFGLLPFGHSAPYLALTVIVWTFGEMLTLPLLTTLVSLRAPAGAQGRYQGMFAMAYSLGIVFGPSVGPRLYAAHGGIVLWSFVTVLGLVAASLLLVISRFWDGRVRSAGP